MTGYDDRCPYCRERATLSVLYGGDVGPCPRHAVHWAGEPGQGPTSLHGNGAASFAFTSGDEDDVTCKLCLALLARERSSAGRAVPAVVRSQLGRTGV